MRESDSASRYDPIAVTKESTVVAEYEAPVRSAADYQSERQLEDALLTQLQDQAYERLTITSEVDLVANLRLQLETLNKISFTDEEWKRFFKASVSSANEGIVEKARRVHEDWIQVLHREDGTQKNIYLLDKTNIHNNGLQVLNQYKADGAYSNRYDVTVLVNGLPMVHVELKRRGVDIREAFNQINRYQRDSFWVGSGLFEYVQLFVISNGTLTKYYSNTVRDGHVRETRTAGRSRKQTSNSYAFASWWADANNKAITDMVGFTKTFFAKHTLLNILTKYCVFDVDQNLLVMRPYQIVAAERILRRIEVSSNYRRYGTVAAGGYIWHTTGSGKTLTSFKAAQLASGLETVEKVLFVVDRKDLDYQTQREYDRFEKGAVDNTTNTAHLKQRMQAPNSRIIVTTIQKLARFIDQNPKHPAFKQHVVLIFDECHRSQFGDMHNAITKSFKKYHLFGFTGTPIFAENSAAGRNPQLKTTEQAFGEKLHTYTVVNAVSDKNVLPFRIDYINTIKAKTIDTSSEITGIETESTLLSPRRIRLVVDYVLEHFDQKTKRTGPNYALKGRRVRGFNSLFAASSIQAAKQYYNAFGRAQADLQAENPGYEPLKIGIIYSFAAPEAQPDGLLPEEGFDPEELDQDSRSFLEDAIQDFNAMFSTSWDTSSEGFQGYYKDFSARLKSRELDMAIVVNMFLTGFDATTLNALWVDKNLRYHGLVQAYSRTNRILNSVKTYGNIISFRDLKQATDDALALFGNKDGGGVVLLRPYAEYLQEFTRTLEELRSKYPDPAEIPASEEAQKDLIRLQGRIMRLRNILTSFDEFTADNPLPEAELQDRQSVYLELHRQYREATEGDKEQIHEDVVFEIELARQDEVNVDYILMLVDKKRQAAGDEDKEIRAHIERSVNASPSLRNKKDLILQFVDKVSMTGSVQDEWRTFVEHKRDEELHTLIREENLKSAETEALVADAFRDGVVPWVGPRINTLFARRSSRFSRANAHGEKKQTVVQKLNTFFERFRGMGE